MKLQELSAKNAPLNEALEVTGAVSIAPNGEAEVQKLRANRVIAGAINNFIASGNINLMSSGKAVKFDHHTGAEYIGIIFGNDPQGNGSITYDASDKALDAANQAISSTGYLFYQFKNSIILGPK